MIKYKKSLKQRINKLYNDYYYNELNKITRLCDQKNIMYQMELDKTAFENREDCIFYLRIYQIINDSQNDSKVGYVYKIYPDKKKRRFKIIYYDDYEKVLFTDNADAVLSILEILFINQSNKRRV